MFDRVRSGTRETKSATIDSFWGQIYEAADQKPAPLGEAVPNPDRYAGQRIFVVRREDYMYLVPFVEDEHRVFLKTIIPSRKATNRYLGEEFDDEDGR